MDEYPPDAEGSQTLQRGEHASVAEVSPEPRRLFLQLKWDEVLARLSSESTQHLDARDAAVRSATNHSDLRLVIGVSANSAPLPQIGVGCSKRKPGYPRLSVHHAPIVSNRCSIVKAIRGQKQTGGGYVVVRSSRAPSRPSSWPIPGSTTSNSSSNALISASPALLARTAL